MTELQSTQSWNIFMLPILLILATFYLVHCWIRHRFSYFSRRSISSPASFSFIFGHLFELWSAHSYSKQLQTWSRQYGPVYGIFEGLRPVYVVSDLDFIQEVFITQFSQFCARRTLFIHRILGVRQLHVFGTRFFEQWKRQRRVLNPAYSASKLKHLLPTIRACTDSFMAKLALTKPNESINIQELYLRLTMDVICRAGFGVKTDVQNDSIQADSFLQKMKDMFHNDLERTCLAKIHRIMPTVQLANLCAYIIRLKRWLRWDTVSDIWLSEHIHRLVEPRLKEIRKNESSVDLLQLMMDAVHSENKEQLTSSEMFSNVFVLLTAGVESTSTVLSYCAYRLAVHPDEQEKIYKEIVKYSTSNVDFYDLLMNKLAILDNFIREVFRMHPIVVQVINRECMESTRVGKYDIEKGSLIQVDLYSINFNQKLWGSEPVDVFYPDRHSEKRHPLTNMAFGAGPRQCLGMRFALMEIKTCLVRLLKEYCVKPTVVEPYKLEIHEMFVIMPDEVCVELVKRS